MPTLFREDGAGRNWRPSREGLRSEPRESNLRLMLRTRTNARPRAITRVRGTGRFAAVWALVAFSLALIAAPPEPGAAVSLTPHRAVYSLDLGTARRDSAVTQAWGRLEFQWDDVCDGWTVRQRTLVTIINRHGGEATSNWSINSWESKDGLSYRFHIRRFRADGKTETVVGTARLDGPGLGGEVVYGGAVERTLKLPEGTLFPTKYSLEMMALAESDALPVWRILFDGFGDDDLQGVSAAMVQAVAAGESASIESALIAGQPSWRVRLAYFPLDRRTPEPDREQGFRVFANGVVDEMVIDYGDFTIDGALENLTPLGQPGC